MDKERLELVAKTLEGVPDERFNMATWARKTDDACGTVCCAVGHYAERHPDQGLKLRFLFGRAELLLRDDPETGGWDAVCTHFDIEECEAFDLFNDEIYERPVTRKAVIERIRLFTAS